MTISKWLEIFCRMVRQGRTRQKGQRRRGPGQPSGLCHLQPCNDIHVVKASQTLTPTMSIAVQCRSATSVVEFLHTKKLASGKHRQNKLLDKLGATMKLLLDMRCNVVITFPSPQLGKCLCVLECVKPEGFGRQLGNVESLCADIATMYGNAAWLCMTQPSSAARFKCWSPSLGEKRKMTHPKSRDQQ